MSPILLCGPTEADGGGVVVEVKPATNIPKYFVAVGHMATEKQSDCWHLTCKYEAKGWN